MYNHIHVYIHMCVVCVSTHTSVRSFMLPSVFLLYILTEDYSVLCMYPLNCKLRKKNRITCSLQYIISVFPH